MRFYTSLYENKARTEVLLLPITRARLIHLSLSWYILVDVGAKPVYRISYLLLIKFRLSAIALLFIFQSKRLWVIYRYWPEKVCRLSSSYRTHTVVHLRYQFNPVFAVLISMPRFKSNNFYQTRPKIKLLLQKNCTIFECWGLWPQTPNGFQQLGVAPTLKSATLVANFWLCTWLVVSTKNANALHQNFSPITSTKE